MSCCCALIIWYFFFFSHCVIEHRGRFLGHLSQPPSKQASKEKIFSPTSVQRREAWRDVARQREGEKGEIEIWQDQHREDIDSLLILAVSIPGNGSSCADTDDHDGTLRRSSLQRSRHFPWRPGPQDPASEGVKVLTDCKELLLVRADRDQAAHEEGGGRLDARSMRGQRLQSGGLQPRHELPRSILERLPDRKISASASCRSLPHGRVEGEGARAPAVRTTDWVLRFQPQQHGDHGKDTNRFIVICHLFKMLCPILGLFLLFCLFQTRSQFVKQINLKSYHIYLCQDGKYTLTNRFIVNCHLFNIIRPILGLFLSCIVVFQTRTPFFKQNNLKKMIHLIYLCNISNSLPLNSESLPITTWPGSQ